MKRRLLVVCGLAMTFACGGGGGGGGGGSQTPTEPTITVSISPSTATNIDQGQTLKFTATVANDVNSQGVTWSVSAKGLTGAACGTLTNTTATTAVYNAPSSVTANTTMTVTATSVADTSAVASAVVVVSPAPAITSTTLENATPNANYSATLEATGGAGGLTWSVAGGALPAGLTLSSSGTISGDPTASGASTFTVQVTDASGATAGPLSAQAQLSLTVVTALSIATTSLPSGSEGVSYLTALFADGGTAPYTWTLTTGSLPTGLTLAAGSGVISGSPGSEGTFNFTVEAQDSSPIKQTETQALSLAIGAPGALAITTTSLLDGTVNQPYHGAVAVTGGTPPYTWSIAAGALPAGLSLAASTGGISGTATSTGTANFSVTVTDSSSPPEAETQALALTIADAPQACASSGNNEVLSGAYAFSLSGFNDVGFLAVVGSFTANGSGGITAGEADTNGVLGVQHGNLITSASSYSAGTDGRGCATLATPFGTLVTHFALGEVSSSTATAGRMIEWDSPSSSAYIAAGQILRQTSTSGGPSGNYVFRTIGWDPAPLGGRDACMGALSAGGNTISAFEQDCNDAWTINNAITPDPAGSYTAPDANGRGTAIIVLGETNTDVTYYMVSSPQMLVVTADPTPALSGEWDLQTMPAGGFTQASLDGAMVFYLSGQSLSGTASAVSVETATADGTSSLAVTFYEDRAGVMQVSGTYACTYEVQSNGRVTLASSNQTCGGTPPLLYLENQNMGYIVDASPGVDAGSFEPQMAGPFTDGSLSGNFFGGMQEVVIQTAQSEVDAVAASGSGTFTGSTDLSSTDAQDAGASFSASSYSVNSDGSFTISSSNGAVVGVIISSTKFVMFSPSTLATSVPALLVMQQ